MQSTHNPTRYMWSKYLQDLKKVSINSTSQGKRSHTLNWNNNPFYPLPKSKLPPERDDIFHPSFSYPSFSPRSSFSLPLLLGLFLSFAFPLSCFPFSFFSLFLLLPSFEPCCAYCSIETGDKLEIIAEPSNVGRSSTIAFRFANH